MEMMFARGEKLVLLCFLAVAAFLDVKDKALPVFYLGAGLAAGIFLQCLAWQMPFYEVLGGCLVGGVLLPVAFLSGQQIGYGDGMALAVTGAFLGLLSNLVLLVVSLFLVFGYVIVFMIIRRNCRNKRIAFLPFLLAGYDLVLLFM